MKYIKKTEVIEAIIFNGDNYSECKDFIEGHYDNTLRFPNVLTPKGVVDVNKGDYIVKVSSFDKHNVFYCYGPDVFNTIYEKVTERLDDKIMSRKLKPIDYPISVGTKHPDVDFRCGVCGIMCWPPEDNYFEKFGTFSKKTSECFHEDAFGFDYHGDRCPDCDKKL